MKRERKYHHLIPSSNLHRIPNLYDPPPCLVRAELQGEEVCGPEHTQTCTVTGSFTDSAASAFSIASDGTLN